MSKTIAYNNKIVIHEEWHSQLSFPLHYVGILTVRDVITQEVKTLVGICSGGDRERDIKSIIDYGSKTRLKGE